MKVKVKISKSDITPKQAAEQVSNAIEAERDREARRIYWNGTLVLQNGEWMIPDEYGKDTAK